jgi:hypothetical protein
MTTSFITKQDNRGWVIAVILAIFGYVATGFMAYTHEDKAMNSRVTALEVHQADDSNRLERVENKIDRMFEAVTGRKP